jgi:chorismate mutase
VYHRKQADAYMDHIEAENAALLAAVADQEIFARAVVDAMFPVSANAKVHGWDRVITEAISTVKARKP